VFLATLGFDIVSCMCRMPNTRFIIAVL